MENIRWLIGASASSPEVLIAVVLIVGPPLIVFAGLYALTRWIERRRGAGWHASDWDHDADIARDRLNEIDQHPERPCQRCRIA